MVGLSSQMKRLRAGGLLRLSVSKQARDDLKGYLFVSPWIISLLVFTAYPMIASFYFAMTDYSILNPPRWVGLGNFEVMFAKDPLYWKSVANTAFYALLEVPLSLIVGLVLAMLLNQRIKGIGFYRTAYYMPGLMPAVASTLLWMVLLDPRLGLVNAALRGVGLPRLGWLLEDRVGLIEGSPYTEFRRLEVEWELSGVHLLARPNQFAACE